jgi:hypothetical protein
MGKYTSLARQLRDEEHNKGFLDSKSVKINGIDIDTNSNAPDRLGSGDTPLRPYAVNAVIQCIHSRKAEACGVCSGYARWLIEDESRLRRARANPEAARREFWRSVRGAHEHRRAVSGPPL